MKKNIINDNNNNPIKSQKLIYNDINIDHNNNNDGLDKKYSISQSNIKKSNFINKEKNVINNNDNGFLDYTNKNNNTKNNNLEIYCIALKVKKHDEWTSESEGSYQEATTKTTISKERILINSLSNDLFKHGDDDSDVKNNANFADKENFGNKQDSITGVSKDYDEGNDKNNYEVDLLLPSSSMSPDDNFVITTLYDYHVIVVSVVYLGKRASNGSQVTKHAIQRDDINDKRNSKNNEIWQYENNYNHAKEINTKINKADGFAMEDTNIKAYDSRNLLDFGDDGARICSKR